MVLEKGCEHARLSCLCTRCRSLHLQLLDPLLHLLALLPLLPHVELVLLHVLLILPLSLHPLQLPEHSLPLPPRLPLQQLVECGIGVLGRRRVAPLL